MAATSTTDFERAREADQTGNNNVVQGRMLPDGDGSETESSGGLESVISSTDSGTLEIEVDCRPNMRPPPSALEVTIGSNDNGSDRVLRVDPVEMDVSRVVHLTETQSAWVGFERDHHHSSQPSLDKPKTNDIMVKCPPVDCQAVENAFGIAYRPQGLVSPTTTQEYDLPSGQAFVDEDEFEAELSMEFRVAMSGRIVSPQTCLMPAFEGGQQVQEVNVGVRKHDQDEEGIDVFGKVTPCSIAVKVSTHEEKVLHAFTCHHILP